jgi:hypothetical protein
MIKSIKDNFLNKISNIHGGTFNSNLYNEIKEKIAAKLLIDKTKITDDVIYLVSHEDDVDSYFMKIQRMQLIKLKTLIIHILLIGTN